MASSPPVHFACHRLIPFIVVKHTPASSPSRNTSALVYRRNWLRCYISVGTRSRIPVFFPARIKQTPCWFVLFLLIYPGQAVSSLSRNRRARMFSFTSSYAPDFDRRRPAYRTLPLLSRPLPPSVCNIPESPVVVFERGATTRSFFDKRG